MKVFYRDDMEISFDFEPWRKIKILVDYWRENPSIEIKNFEKLKKEELINKIGIMDLDFHYGDGTDDIIYRKEIDYIEHWGLAKDLTSNTFYFFVNCSTSYA